MRTIRYGTAILLGGAALAWPGATLGATIGTTTFNDERDVPSNTTCSLREAVQSANANANFGGCTAVGPYAVDTILLRSGTYRLTIPSTNENLNVNGDLDVTSPVEIAPFPTPAKKGPQPISSVTLDGAGNDRVLDFSAAAVGAAVRGLTITGGKSPAGFLGGGIFVGGKVTITDSTISGNTGGASGGGIGASGATTTLMLRNTTVSGNISPSNGGGIEFQGGSSLTLVDSTVAGNTAAAGGGVQFTGAAKMAVGRSIIADNLDTTAPIEPDCSAPAGVTSQGGNLIGAIAGCAFVSGPGDVVNQVAKLGPLANNGGPTFTHALLKGSPAIDKLPACPLADQRGAFAQGACDIGAYELVRCGGVPINRVGTLGPDLVKGTNGPDSILGAQRADLLKGLGGKDVVCGGSGQDKLVGGAGKDRLLGQRGRDRCIGGAGKDSAGKCEVVRGL